RCAPALRHGAFRRSRRGRAPPESRRALRLRHLDDAQDARRPARGIHPVPRRARAGRRPRRLPGDAGRPARAHDRREGDVLQDRDVRAVPGLPAADPLERRRPRGDAAGRRARPPDRRDRHASHADRPAQLRVDGQGRGGAPARGADHRQPQHGAVRRATADGRVGRSHRNARDDDARLRRRRLPRDGPCDLRRADGVARPRRPARTRRSALREAAAVPRVPRLHDVRPGMIQTKRVTVVEHPLVQHKLSYLRDRETPTVHFRKLANEITLLLTYEATKDFPTEDYEIETPLETMTAQRISGKKVAVCPVLRAGVGMLDGVLSLVSSARVGFIGMYRDEETLQPVQYYSKLPTDLVDRDAIVLDPMLATG